MSIKPAKVYFLPWDKKDRLSELLGASGLAKCLAEKASVAIKTHFGEKGNIGYVKPVFFAPLIDIIKEVNASPFLTDTNTIYHGERSTATRHLKIAAAHGFSKTKLGVPIVIADGENGSVHVDVEVNGTHFKSVHIAKSIYDANMIVAVSHFKGHMLAGFGGAIKNLGMGCGSRVGKFEMHSTVSPSVASKKCNACGNCVNVCAHSAILIVDGAAKIEAAKCKGCGQCIVVCPSSALSLRWSESGKNVQEKFVEYALGAVKGKKIFCVTFINNVTENCDCMGVVETPLVEDIGIMASLDPVAIDQAALDITLKTAGKDIFRKVHPQVDYNVQLEYAEKIRLGTRDYASPFD